eukprot:s4937_g5.t1
MADSEHILMTMKEHLQLARNEEAIAAGDAMNIRASGIREQQGLNDSGHKKLKSIDVKLEVAMTGMLRAGGDKAAELYLEVNRKANDYVRSYEGKIIKGRQIIAMMYESFRTRDRLDMIVSLDYLVKLQCQGDNKLHQFKQTWLEILNRMRQEDIPSEKALRDCLYNKIKDSPAMKWELG